MRALLILLFWAGFAQAQPLGAGKTYALVVAGLPGQPPYDHWYADWAARFRNYLLKQPSISPEDVTMLTEATTESILHALAGIAKRSSEQDQLIVFIVGHGSSSQAPTLTLAGPDLTANQLAAALASVKAQRQIVLNFNAASGDFLKTLAAPRRVNITATSPTEIDEPVLAEFFLRGLESGRADADGNRAISVLEAFNWSATQATLWIARWQQTNLDAKDTSFTTWKADGRETIEIFEKLYGGLDARKLDKTSDRNADDPIVDIQPPNGEVNAAWKGRRILDEHALLEDCGQPIGVSVLGEKGFQPILGQNAGDPGYLAGKTFLGRLDTP